MLPMPLPHGQPLKEVAESGLGCLPRHGSTRVQMQMRNRVNFEQEGFTNVRIMVSSFLVRARDKHGNPVMMVINPYRSTASAQGPNCFRAAGQGVLGRRHKRAATAATRRA